MGLSKYWHVMARFTRTRKMVTGSSFTKMGLDSSIIIRPKREGLWNLLNAKSNMILARSLRSIFVRISISLKSTKMET